MSETPKSRPNPLAAVRTRGWVSLRDFCTIADITYPTAVRWAKLDMIKYVQVGGTKRIYEEEIARFLQHGTLKPDEEKRQTEIKRREEYRYNAAIRRANQGSES